MDTPLLTAESAPKRVAPSSPTFIRVVEVWVPDSEGALLTLGSAWYGAAKRFGLHSQQMCFGRGEGLPGQAWEAGHPIVLKQFEGSAFRRTQAAHAEGLTCGIALPVFNGSVLSAVVLIFCGDSPDPEHGQAGAIELWRNTSGPSKDLLLEDGYYGATADVFEFISRRTAFRKGTGLPGLAWESGLPVFMPDLGKGGRFLRADGAQRVGINRGFAIPCATAGSDTYVMAFLSALATPLVRRFESWQPAANNSDGHLVRHEGFCESAGTLAMGTAAEHLHKGQGVVGRAWASGLPLVSLKATTEPGAVGQGASRAGTTAVVALPVLQGGQVVAVVAWYL